MPQDIIPDDDADLVPEGLVYVTDTQRGIRRSRRDDGFDYHRGDGRPVGPRALARVQALAIPPAWDSVWICRDAAGHLQATGLDQRGRKQYLYHPDWARWRAETKYTQLADFGAALGPLRRRIDRDLAREVGDLDFSLAALTMLIDRACLRVGTRVYLRDNSTFGATTLLTRHLSVADGRMRLRFRAKGGKPVVVMLEDRRLQRILQSVGDLPGRHLFSWIDSDGDVRPVESHHVNAYIAAATGLPNATAKTFRTWGGSLAAFEVARLARDRLSVKAMAEAAAARLANTPAICKSSYIHPRILALATLTPEARQGALADLPARGHAALRATERRMRHFLAQGNLPADA